MEQLNAIAAKFFGLPFIAEFFQSHAMLRIASKDYGTPLFLILVATVTLVLLLLVSKIKPKKGRPKVIKEDKPKKERAPRRARKESKPKATPKAIMRKLEKLPASTLPLYPVADKKREQPEDPAPAEAPALMPEAAAAPALDPFADPPPQPMAEAETIMAEPAPEIELEADMDAALNAITADDLPAYDPALDEPDSAAPTPTPQADDFGGGLSADDFDISVPSFGKDTPGNDAPATPAASGGGDNDGLSDEARRKFEELQQRGVTQ
ncbi:MAG: hypothetical protein ACON4P_05080 [Candidatus Puniceispirillales bacterium]